MGDFSLLGGVGIMGVLTPMDSRDDYAVTDTVYGVDGLRNVSTVNDLHTVSLTRRRPGMIVGVNGGEHYYKLKDVVWSYDMEDWEELTLRIQHIDREIPSGIIDGVNKVFGLTKTPEMYSEHLFLNGLLQDSEQNEDYAISENTITFIDAPLEGSKIRCSYRHN